MIETTERISNLPLFFICPESGRKEDEDGKAIVLVKPPNEMADLGSAVHDYAKAYVQGEEVSNMNLADKYQVEIDDLEALAGAVRKQWENVKQYFADCTEVHVEQRVSYTIENSTHRLNITGKSDYIGVEPEALAVLDWKSGYLDTDHFHQLMGYAYGALEAWGSDKTKLLMMFTVMLRTGEVDIVRISPDDVFTWAETMLTRTRDGLGTFKPGTHCANCPRAASCPGKMVYDESITTALATIDAAVPSVDHWTKDNHLTFGAPVCDALRQIKYWTDRMDAIKKFVKGKVIEYGPLKDGEGRAYKVIEVNRRSLDTPAAKTVLQEHLGDQLINAVKFHLPTAEKIVMEGAGPGQKKLAKKALLDDLELVNAIKVSPSLSLREGKA